MRNVLIRDLGDAVGAMTHNTEVLARAIKKTNRKTGLVLVAGIIFGITTRLRFAEQEATIVELSREIKELRDEKGD